MASESFKGTTNIERNGIKGSDLMVFSFATIVAATINFVSENKLWIRWFRPVCKVLVILKLVICLKSVVVFFNVRNCNQKALKNIRTSACGIQEHQLFQEKNQLFIKLLPKKSGGSCHHTSGNRSVVHDTVNNIRRKSSSYIREHFK